MGRAGLGRLGLRMARGVTVGARRGRPMLFPVHDLDRNFDHHRPDEGRAARHESARNQAKALASAIVALTRPGREQSLALTKVEEAMFWANAAIAREGAGDG